MKKNYNQQQRLDFIAKRLEGFSINLARVLNSVGITPNMVTLSRLSIGFCSAFLFFLQGYLTDLFALFFLGLFFFLDLVDGDLARKYNKTSKLGKFMDGFLDAIIINLVLFAIYENLNVTGNFLRVFPVLAILGQALSVYISQNYETRFGVSAMSLDSKIQSYSKSSKIDNVSKFLFELVTPTNILSSLFSTLKYYLVAGVLLGIIPLAVMIYALMINLRWTVLALTLGLYYKYHQLKKKINFFYILSVLERDHSSVK